jgi:hypothetical protein
LLALASRWPGEKSFTEAAAVATVANRLGELVEILLRFLVGRRKGLADQFGDLGLGFRNNLEATASGVQDPAHVRLIMTRPFRKQRTGILGVRCVQQRFEVLRILGKRYVGGFGLYFEQALVGFCDDGRDTQRGLQIDVPVIAGLRCSLLCL